MLLRALPDAAHPPVALGLGFAGAALGLVATVYSGYTQDFGFSTLSTVLYIPIGVQEMVLAVWLLAKGFNPSSVDGDADSMRSRHAGRPTGGVRQESSTWEGAQLVR